MLVKEQKLLRCAIKPYIAILVLLWIGSYLNLQAASYYNDVSLSLLRGHNYKVGHPDRTVVTLEYVNGSSWGDFFMFADHIMPDQGDSSDYMEFSPRLKLLDWNEGIIRSLLLSATWEHSEFRDNLLVGPAIDLKIDGFRYLKLNFYRRFNENLDDSYQFTPVWAIPFELGDQQWLWDGFLDWSSATSATSPSMHSSSQLKWLVNQGRDGQKFYLGAEYTYWHNKFGIQGVTENQLILLLKYHF